MYRLLLLALLASTACRSCPTCPVPLPPVVKVVPSSDPHCLTQQPKAIADVVAELKALPKTDPGTRAQLERLADGYADAYAYAWRAWRLCGTLPEPSPAAAGSGAP